MQQVQTSKVYFPNLDGFRFLSFFAVFLHHSFGTHHQYILNDDTYQYIQYGILKNGNLGVNFFFVLSGFLITYLLLKEKEDFKRVNIPMFYMRRVLKIWPLFFFVVFFGFVLFPVIKLNLGETPTESANFWNYLTFTNNFDLITNGTDSSALSILWSVAVEEQFYLVWPLVLAFIAPKYLPAVFTVIIAASYLFRLPYTGHQHERIFDFHTVSCISDLTVGAFGAYLSYYSIRFKSFFRELHRGVIIGIYLLAAVCIFFKQTVFGGSHYWTAFGRVVISIIFLMILLEQNYSRHSFFKMARFKMLSRLGGYTYGLYCMHMMAILIAAVGLSRLGLNTNIWELFIIEGLVSLLLSFGIAWLSFHYYEKPFLVLKRRFSKVKTINPEVIERRQAGDKERVETAERTKDPLLYRQVSFSI